MTRIPTSLPALSPRFGQYMSVPPQQSTTSPRFGHGADVVNLRPVAQPTDSGPSTRHNDVSEEAARIIALVKAGQTPDLTGIKQNPPFAAQLGVALMDDCEALLRPDAVNIDELLQQTGAVDSCGLLQSRVIREAAVTGFNLNKALLSLVDDLFNGNDSVSPDDTRRFYALKEEVEEPLSLFTAPDLKPFRHGAQRPRRHRRAIP